MTAADAPVAATPTAPSSNARLDGALSWGNCVIPLSSLIRPSNRSYAQAANGSHATNYHSFSSIPR
jgi:hypothetical protein